MSHSLPNLASDLLLLHAPAFFDFRNRRDIYFPYLSTSGDVPITPLYEYFPLGWKTLQRFLSERDHSVRIVNLSGLLLRYPSLSANAVFSAFDVRLLGIDLHWMVHVQGSLDVASRFKRVQPDVPVMAEMEAWIDRALSLGIHNVDVWFFIGMPEQDENAVKAEVDYCARLLDKFSGRRVTPLLCPMMPFLDPASTFFENPEENGYHVFYRTVEEHRCGMQRASVINRINYETRWLSRADLVHVGYRAVAEVMHLRAKTRQLPTNVAKAVSHAVNDALAFIDVVHEADCLSNPADRTRAMEELGDGIVERNQAIFSSEVANQAFPINRQIGGRWFDEMGWTPAQLDCVLQAGKS